MAQYHLIYMTLYIEKAESGATYEKCNYCNSCSCYYIDDYYTWLTHMTTLG